MVKSPIHHQTNSNPYDKIVFLFGPTGVGKTCLLSSLDPSRFSVINADSIQVYRGLDIGSAKATKDQRKAITHYLLDIEDPWNQFTVARFIEEADQACGIIASEGKIPIISGGTAYYFKHFLYGLSEAPASDPLIRAKIAALVEEKGLVWAYDRLAEIDPQSAERIKPQDSYRITRALEVWETSGKPLSDFALPDVPRFGMPYSASIWLLKEPSVRLRMGKSFSGASRTGGRVNGRPLISSLAGLRNRRSMLQDSRQRIPEMHFPCHLPKKG